MLPALLQIEVPMIKRLKACLVFSLLICLAPLACGAGETHVFRLENGLSVLIREDARFPLVSVRLFVRAGSAWEKPEEAGMSHLLEHMVFKGSKTSGPGVDKLVENAGGSMNAYTSYDMTTFLTDLPASKWRQAMKAVRDLAFDPLLRQSDLDAEREVVIAEMKQRGDIPGTRLFLSAMASTLKGTPYEYPVIGNEKALRAMTPGMLRSYIDRRYDPRDMTLCVVGDIHAREVLDEAKALLGGYANRNVCEAPQTFDPRRLARGFSAGVEPGPWKKVFAALSFPIGGANHGMQPALDVLCALLDSEETSLLQRELRIRRQVVDSVSASPMALERAGALLITAQMDPAKAQDFLRITGEKLRSLRAADFSDEEIARVKLNIEDNYLRGLEKIASIAETIGHEYFYDPASLGGGKYLDAVRSVGRTELQRVIDEWLKPEALSLTALIPDHQEGAAADERSLRHALAQGWPEVLTAKPQVLADGTSGAEKEEVIVLGEGCSLALRPDRTLPYVSATLMFRGGELLVPQGREGLARLTAGALTAGTHAKQYEDMSVFLASRASSLTAGSGTRSFSLSADAPKRFSAEVLSLLKEVLEGPAFREKDVARIKVEQCASIASAEESAMGMAGRNLRSFLFAGGPYAHRADGDAKTVGAATRDDIIAFWKRQSAQPWVLSVAGDFDREEILRYAQSLPRPSAPEATCPAPSWSADKTLTMTLPGRDQAVYLMLFPAADADAPDRQAVRLLAAVLDGFTGKLYQDLRERQSLGYSVFPIDWADRKAGFIGFGIVAAPGNLGRARESFVRLTREIREELFSQEALDRAKAVTESGYVKSRQSRAARAAEGAAAVLDGYPMDHSLQKLREMKAVGAGAVREAARKYLDTGSCYELTVAPGPG